MKTKNFGPAGIKPTNFKTTLVILFGVLVLKHFGSVSAEHQYITSENIADECNLFDNAAMCLFLARRNNKRIELTPITCKSAINNNNPCMRVNIKPTSDPCRHEFQLAAININKTDYIGAGISKDKQMLADYGFYCTSEKSVAGLILTRVAKKGSTVFNSQLNWRKNPQMNGQQSKGIGGTDKIFLNCSFTTDSSHFIGGNIINHPQFEVALGKGNSSLNLLMSVGRKNSHKLKTDDLMGQDHHYMNGYHSDLNSLASSTPEKCGRSSTTGKLGGYSMLQVQQSVLVVLTLFFHVWNYELV